MSLSRYIRTWAEATATDIVKGGMMVQEGRVNAYLMIVKREGKKWVVDDDSVHLLEDEGGNYPVQELTVSQIRAITREEQIPTSVAKLPSDEAEDGS